MTFDYNQYQQDAIDSKENPLPKKLLPGFDRVGIDIEVFALPGLETDHKRYILSQRSLTSVVKKSHTSTANFFSSDEFKSVFGNSFTPLEFYVKKCNSSILGIPLEVAIIYWTRQAYKGNKAAQDIIDTLIGIKLDKVKTKRKPPKTASKGFIYFISNGSSVKVGFSKQPERRLSDLQTAHNKKLELLETIKAEHKIEKMFHTKNKHIALSGEWYPIEKLEVIRQEIQSLLL
jgi:hypothetical protein